MRYGGSSCRMCNSKLIQRLRVCSLNTRLSLGFVVVDSWRAVMDVGGGNGEFQVQVGHSLYQCSSLFLPPLSLSDLSELVCAIEVLNSYSANQAYNVESSEPSQPIM